MQGNYFNYFGEGRGYVERHEGSMELTSRLQLEMDDEWAKKRHSDRDEGIVLPLIRKFTSKIILLSGHD